MSRLKLTNQRLTDRQRVLLWVESSGFSWGRLPTRVLRGLVLVDGAPIVSDSAKGAIGQPRRR